MLKSNQVEELICIVAALDRTALVNQIHRCRASFPIDFTDQFLQTVPLDRLRHIFVALCMQQQYFPDVLSPVAA